MSESEKETFSRETQKERWVKYGSNVALTIIVVIVLAGLIVYLAQRTHRIVDTRQRLDRAEAADDQSHQGSGPKIKIVSLYASQGRGGETRIEKKARLERKQAVEDLLTDYSRYGKNVSIDFIDPDTNPSKVDALISEITTQYGGEVAKYKQFLAGYPDQQKKIKTLSESEYKAIAGLPIDEVKDNDLKTTLVLMVATVEGLGQYLDEQQDAINRLLKQEPPDYKGATDRVRSTMDDFSQQLDLVIQRLGDAKENKATPDAFKKYAEESTPRYQEIKKEADAIVKQIDSLGELKLDQLRQSLKQHDSILVMGPSDLRVIPYEKVWVPDVQNQIKNYLKGGEEPEPSFAGEQAITTTIVSLVRNSKPKVVFIRPGGAPLATPGMPPFQRGGPLSDVADRLREYNFEVLEKDLSGQYAMQAQMQGMPAEPEPTDEQIKDAVWVCLPLPQNQQQQPMPSVMGPKLAEHLKQGGSALVLLVPQSDDLSSVTKDYGIEGNGNAVIVHEAIPPAQGAQGDQLDEAQRLQFVFDIRDYGDHEITRPLRSLRSFLVPLQPVKASDAKDCKVTPLIPIPNDPPAWATSNIDSLEKHDTVKFVPAAGDIPPPLYGMAVSEKKDGARLAVIGCPQFAFNTWLEEPDPEIARARRKLVARFPANADLFMNTIYWLSKEDTMIAISPAAMQVPRIADMKDGR